MWKSTFFKVSGLGLIGLALAGPAPANAAPPPEAQIAVKAVTASSTLKKWKTFTFDAANLIDGKVETSWQPAKNDTFGVGQWVEFDLGETYEITRIEVSQGLQLVDPKLGDLFCRNNRFEAANIWLDDGTRGEVSVGSPDLRTFEFRRFARGWHTGPGHETKTAARRFRLIIERVLEPVDWTDLAIAEVRVFGRPTTAPTVDPKSVLWDRPGAWPFWVAVSDYCAVNAAKRTQRNCDELVRTFASGHASRTARIVPFKPVTEATLATGAVELAFDGFKIDFKRAGDGTWQVVKSVQMDLGGKPYVSLGESFYMDDQYGDNPCWESLKKKRPYEVIEPYMAPDDDQGSDDFGED